MTKFRNPVNGYEEEVGSAGPFFGALFLGLLYFAFKGLWTHSVAALPMILLFASLGPFGVFLIFVMWVIYACLARSLIVANYLKRGWITVDGQQSGGAPTNADEKICPTCAETIKSAAMKCRFCGHEFNISQTASRPI
ncbi:MAG: zinc ribbon domain-containing protein [Bryobacteraceae bacterium]